MTIYLGPGELAFDVCKWPKALVRVIHLNGSYVPEAEVSLGNLNVGYRESCHSELARQLPLGALSRRSITNC